MSALWSFLSRTQGGTHNGVKRLTVTDYLCYLYLIIGFLVIFIPVCWIALNSIKSDFQLEKQDISLLPTDYERVGRGTVNGPDGREIFFLSELPDWVLNWSDLRDEEKAQYDPLSFIEERQGREYYVLRSHLGLVANQTRQMITDLNLPVWLTRYSSMATSARDALDIDSVLLQLDDEQQRLLKEYLGIKPYKANRLVSQVLVTAPDPETGDITSYAVASVTSLQKVLPARSLINPSGKVVLLPKESITANSFIKPAWNNYTDPLRGKAYGVNVDFVGCITNSVLVTVIATLITLLINSMAAFSLSKYQFRGQVFFFVVILATLMVPATITLVGVFKAINATGLSGSIWGVIIPGAATPTGIFLLRQYMLTIPDELLEAARMDAASEWKVYWRIVLPLALPAMAALGILSVIWRWNDLILPMVAIATSKEAYTIQLCLLEFRGEHLSQEHYRLAMTMISLIPTTLVFVFLQKYITTGIANSGLK